eukprot:4915072-Amphidinium_carterae.1
MPESALSFGHPSVLDYLPRLPPLDRLSLTALWGGWMLAQRVNMTFSVTSHAQIRASENAAAQADS